MQGISAPPDDGQVPRVSRLNADGTPFQFGLTLGSTAPLQFLSEPTGPSARNVERLQAARGRIDALSSLFGIGDVADVHAGWICAAPVDDPDLAADDAGPVWLGGIHHLDAPTLKVYVNAKWGLPLSLDADRDVGRLCRRCCRMAYPAAVAA